MPDKLGTRGIADVVLLLLGIDIVASQASAVVAGLAFVVARFDLVAGSPVEDVMKMFGMV